MSVRDGMASSTSIVLRSDKEVLDHVSASANDRFLSPPEASFSESYCDLRHAVLDCAERLF